MRHRYDLPPLRVALVTETYPPEVNGVAMTLGRMVGGLRQRGHRVQLVRPRQRRQEAPGREPDFEEVLVPGLPIPRYPDLHLGLPAGGCLSRLWSAQRPDIVHVATEGPLGWSAVAAARGLGLPVSSSFHTNFDAYSRHYGLGWLNRSIARYLRHFHNRTEATLVPTSSLAQALADDGFRNLAVLARGADTRLFNPARRSPALRQRWRVPADSLVVAYVGRLAPEKNLDLVCAAFEEIRCFRPDARLLFVGDGPSAAALARCHPEYLYAGTRRGEDLAAHYASADLFLFPSLTETYGNVIAEALASGLAVVAFDRAAAADLIRDGDNGRCVPPGDDHAFVRAAVELAVRPQLLAFLGRRAALSVAHLEWERIHDCFAELLADLVAGSKGRRFSPASTGRNRTAPS